MIYKKVLPFEWNYITILLQQKSMYVGYSNTLKNMVGGSDIYTVQFVHLWNNFCIPSKSYSFYAQTAQLRAFSDLRKFFRRSYFFARQPKNEQKFSKQAYVTKKQVRVRVQGFEPKSSKTAQQSHFRIFCKKVYFWSY